jgi:hypothetical protein
MFEEIFGSGNYLPASIKNEFIKRWETVEKLTFREFFISIRDDNNRDWWNTPGSIDHCYNSYIKGCIEVRYPRIPIHPSSILVKIVKEADEMIKF